MRGKERRDLLMHINRDYTRSGTRTHDLGKGEILNVPAATNWAHTSSNSLTARGAPSLPPFLIHSLLFQVLTTFFFFFFFFFLL
ncbi:hypothetical protein RIF29_35291 [Crotalaria pallida]|uniref:Uncharacterized protein n=1 Tax=Crotalaria pallida TaxID=3830 RepID=A0AAN9HTQ8_CROPI